MLELGEKPTKEELYKMISEVDKKNKGFIGKISVEEEDKTGCVCWNINL